MKYAVKHPELIPTLEKSFLSVIKILKPIGKDVFRGGNFVFSTSLYDCVMIGLSKHLQHYENERTDLLIDRINKLKESESFKKASGSASASKSRIIKRIEVAEDIFQV